ncbi:MAG TPA: AsmA family protein [Candidatus Cybelea sp.]|nr:AsmA family protein [Candidatus Cybelea sp.]
MRIKRLLTVLVIIVVGATAALFAIIRSIDFNSYKELVQQQVKAATGRDLVLAGDVKVGLSLTPRLVIDQVSFRNADWGSEPQMVKLDHLEADVALLPLLSSQIRITRLHLIGADILLETDKTGKGNWVMGNGAAGGSGGAAPLPDVGEASIENAKIRLRSGTTGQVRTLEVDRLTLSSSATPDSLGFSFAGKIDTLPVTLNGITGTPASFVQGPLPINATGQIVGADLAIKGQIDNPGQMKGVALDLTLSGSRASDLAPLFGVQMPGLGAFQLRGKLSNADTRFALDDFAGKIGGTDFTGHIDADPSAVPPSLNMALASSHLDFADLGVSPAASGAKSTDGRVFSAAPWDFSALKAVNGQFRLNAQQAILGKTTLDNLTLDSALDSGKLKIVSLTAGLGQGNLGLAANVDGAAAPAKIEARLRASNVDGAPLLDALGLGGALTAGKVNLEAAVQGPGASLRDLMAGLNGGIHMEMGQGAIRNDFARLMFADLFQLVTFGGTGDAARVNCMATDFQAVDGIAGAKTMVLDTPGVTVVGTGDVNLRDESLHLHLDSNSKQVNLANLAVPLNVGGTLSHPAVAPDPLGAVGNTADFAARAANTATFGVLSSLTGLGASKDLGSNPCLDAAAAGAKAKQSSAGEKILNGLGTAGEGVGQGAKELGQDAIDATKKAGEGAGQMLDNVGKGLGGVFGN